jgi:hypothetical protein
MSGKVSNAIITNGLVLYTDAANKSSYPGSGNNWNDISQNGTIGTLFNNPTFNSGSGGFLTFTSGSTTYVSGSDRKGLLNVGATGSVTIEAFIYPTTSGNQGYIFSYGNATGSLSTSYAIGIFNTGIFIARTDQSTNLSGTVIPINQWSSVTAVFNPSGGASRYLNGNIYGSGGIYTKNPNSGDWYIGALTSGSANTLNFTGNIACIRVYNRVLSATEVLQNYNALKPRFGL